MTYILSSLLFFHLHRALENTDDRCMILVKQVGSWRTKFIAFYTHSARLEIFMKCNIIVLNLLSRLK